MPILKNPRWERFAQLLAEGKLSVEKAFAEAGYNLHAANARRLRLEPRIQARLAELIAPVLADAEITVTRVLKEMSRLAFYDATEVLAETDGKKLILKDPRTLPEDLRRAIVDFRPVKIGDEVYYRCKLADKQKSLEMLARHLQMFKDTVVIENVFRVVKDMSDDELNRRLAELERADDQATPLDFDPGNRPPSVH